MNEERFGPILFLPGPNQGKYPYCHSLFIDAGVKVLVDPASDPERLAALRENPGVDQVWLTHYHEDHFMHLGLFDDLPFYIHQADAAALTDLEIFIDYYNPVNAHRSEWASFITDLVHFRPRRAAGFLEPGTVDLGGVTVEILYAPGHTRGHCALHFPEQKVLFQADYDLTPFGPYYGDQASDIDQTIDSVNRLRAIEADVRLTCHEQGIFRDAPPELWDRYLGVIDQREARLLEVLRRPSTMEEIIEARIVYRKAREPKMFFDFGEMGLMRQHLKRLMDQGRVVRDGETYRLV